jgi:putative phage-type endonuclease
MRSSPYKTRYKLWREKVLGEEQPMNLAMQRGVNLESKIREEVEKLTGQLFPSCVQVHPQYPWMMCSFDGLSEDGTVLEIKTTSAQKLQSMLVGDIFQIPEMWQWQVQHQLCFPMAKKAILYVSDGKIGFQVQIPSDPYMIEDLISEEEVFWREHVMKMIPPKLEKGDWKERNDEEWSKAAAEMILATDNLEIVQRRYDEARQDLIRMSGEESCEGAGVVVTKFFSKGSVDYSSIPELNGVDLEKYRKPGRESWRVT